jgi:hypothetical protein
MMRHTLVVLATAAALAVADPSFAGQRGRRGEGRGNSGGRAVPRSSQRAAPPVGRDGPRRSYNRGDHTRGRFYGPGARYYYGYPYFSGYPRYYGFYPYSDGWYGYGYPTYGYPTYGYQGFGGVAPSRLSGGVRIDLTERDAEVLVDGYYAGIVDDFDGTFQELKLEPGPHRIEIRAEGFEPVAFDVDVEIGRTITYRTRLRPE